MHYIVYETKNIINGKIYRGCHQTENLNDGYIGSGKWFLKAVDKYGAENFKRIILCECETFEEMVEKEAFYIDEDFVERSDTYNLQTGGWNRGILCKESKLKLSNSVKESHKNGNYDYSRFLGVEPWNKVKRDIYSSEALDKMSKAAKRNRELGIYDNVNFNPKGIAWNKGIKVGPMKEEQKAQISQTLKERYSNSEHHLKGKPSPHKGKKTGKSSWNAGIILEKNIECPHCKIKGGNEANMKRWHFDNCKNKGNK